MIHQDETVILDIAQGEKMEAYVARPAHLRDAPGLILLQEAFGVNHHMKSVAHRLAKEGYLVIVPELFHRTAQAGFVGDYENFDSVMPHFSKVTDHGILEDVKASHRWLLQNLESDIPSIGIIGFCMGGRAAFLANGSLALKASVSFYGGRIAPDLLPLAKTQSGALLLFWGARDSLIPKEQRREVIDALSSHSKAFTTVLFSDADHGFFCDERKSYLKQAAHHAWSQTLEFLKHQLKKE